MDCRLSAQLFLRVEAQLDAAALGYKVPSSGRLTDVATGSLAAFAAFHLTKKDFYFTVAAEKRRMVSLTPSPSTVKS